MYKYYDEDYRYINVKSTFVEKYYLSEKTSSSYENNTGVLSFLFKIEYEIESYYQENETNEQFMVISYDGIVLNSNNELVRSNIDSYRYTGSTKEEAERRAVYAGMLSY